MVFSYHTIILFHLNDLIKQQVLPPPLPPPPPPLLLHVSNPPARPSSLPLPPCPQLPLCHGMVALEARFPLWAVLLPPAQVAAREKRSIGTLLLAAALIGIEPHH